ncbi:MAG: hypothetical protein HGA78_07420 [Nitrospirales bacterium]|nr:hypothetical protein [Nitrospirales bacterium]
MFGRLRKDLDEAVRQIKWFSSLFSERVRMEVIVFKLLYRSEELKKKRDELYRTIGQEVYEMKGRDKDPYSQKAVSDAIRELDALEPEISETIQKASEISRVVS